MLPLCSRSYLRQRTVNFGHSDKLLQPSSCLLLKCHIVNYLLSQHSTVLLVLQVVQCFQTFFLQQFEMFSVGILLSFMLLLGGVRSFTCRRNNLLLPLLSGLLTLGDELNCFGVVVTHVLDFFSDFSQTFWDFNIWLQQELLDCDCIFLFFAVLFRDRSKTLNLELRKAAHDIAQSVRLKCQVDNGVVWDLAHTLISFRRLHF